MSDLRWWVEKMRGLRAYVVGDAIVDQYEFGRCARLSPEAPVPVFIPEHSETRQGGAANVAANLSALGLEVETTFAPPSQWSKKTRFMVGHHPLLRVDEDQQGELEESNETMREKLKRADVLVLSDYSKGALQPRLCQFLIDSAFGMPIPVIVDPKGTDWEKYRGATVLCPNELEWHAVDCHQPDDTVIVAKHGAKGLAVIRKLWDVQEAKLYPARAHRVFDVTGAGDTVVSAVAATLAAGGDLDAAAQIANAAAGVVVEEIGTSVCTAAQLLERLG